MKKIDDWVAIFIMGFVTAFVINILFVWDALSENVSKKYEAAIIQRGYGLYVVDQKTKKVSFEWTAPPRTVN